MFRALGDFVGGDGYTNLSFRRPEQWASMPVEAPVRSTAALLGDEATGPVLLLLELPPGVTLPPAPAHGHASDTWRMPLAGTLPMGPDSYEPGEFRFQAGWKPYASDNLAGGPDGGWTALLFGDRRGLRVRPVQADGPAVSPLDRAASDWLRVGGDLVSDDPAHAPGPSCLSTTIGDRPGRARINGSFGATDGWFRFGEARVAGAWLGHPVTGPLVLLTAIGAGGRPLASYSFGTEVLRLVVRGSCQIGEAWYRAGDIRVEHAGSCGPAKAGPDGVDEVVIIADRRFATSDSIRDPGWASTLEAVAARLRCTASPAGVAP